MATILRISAERESRLAWLNAGTPLERATRALAVLTGFSIPLSTSLSEITTGLFVGCWLCSGGLRTKWTLIRNNVIAVLSLALFGLLLAGMTWSVETWSAAARCLLKYRELVYLPMFLVVFREERLRTMSISAFILGAVILQGLSYYEMLFGADFGIISNPLDYVVFKDRIIHSSIMVLLAYLAAVRLAGTFEAAASHAWPKRAMYAAVFGLALHSVLCMVQSRTGYLMLAVVTTLFLIERLGRRGLAIAAILLAVSAWGGLMVSKTIRDRAAQTISQIRNEFGGERKHSPDARMEFFANAAKLVRRHPYLGTGTGSFQAEYARLVAGSDDAATSDPHNEYLLLAVQVGIPGAVLFVVLLSVQWFVAARLPATERQIGRGITGAIAAGCLFNSLILSVTGGLLYAYFSGLAYAELSDGTRADMADDPTEADEAPALRRAA